MKVIYLCCLFISFYSCNEKSIYLKINPNNKGKYCYILWSSDSIICKKSNFVFDSNNVTYVYTNLKNDKSKIKIIDSKNNDLTDNMINIMGNIENTYLTFYCPTVIETSKHPRYDEYYQDKLLGLSYPVELTIWELEKLGYKIE